MDLLGCKGPIDRMKEKGKCGAVSPGAPKLLSPPPPQPPTPKRGPWEMVDNNVNRTTQNF